MTEHDLQPFTRSRLHPPAAPRLRAVDAARTVHLTIVLKPRDLPAVIEQPITRAEYAARHATPRAVIDRLTEYAESHGLRVDDADAVQHIVRLSGTYAQATSAFHPENLAVYGTADSNFVARHGTLSVPADLAHEIVAITGFDQRPVARSRARIRPRQAATGTSYDPASVAQRYQFPTGVTGTGQTIALIELGGGYDAEQMASYFQAHGIARTGTLTSVSVDGAQNSPGDPNGPDGEVQLDIEVAGSAAPGANIAVYFGSNQASGFLNLVAAAVHDQQRSPQIISISWGGPESAWAAQDLDAMNQAFQSAATLGITVCAASGDSGALDNAPDGKPSVDFPASSPYVLGCGGTRLPQTGSETAWNGGAEGGASGGGYSKHFAKPTWQAGNAESGRGVPDVAGDADPATGYNIAVDGQDSVAGGTSAVAPLWAALIALCNQSLGRAAGFVNPSLYAHPAALTDITTGNNDGFSAGPGWDPVTGLGSPIGTAVLAALSQATPVA